MDERRDCGVRPAAVLLLDAADHTIGVFPFEVLGATTAMLCLRLELDADLVASETSPTLGKLSLRPAPPDDSGNGGSEPARLDWRSATLLGTSGDVCRLVRGPGEELALGRSGGTRGSAAWGCPEVLIVAPRLWRG